jgi:hypothetical protein
MPLIQRFLLPVPKHCWIRELSDLPGDPSSNVPQVTKAGRGWLGRSGDIHVSKFCFSDEDCRQKKSEISWRGRGGFDLYVLTFRAKFHSLYCIVLYVSSHSRGRWNSSSNHNRCWKVCWGLWLVPSSWSDPSNIGRTPDLSHGAASGCHIETNANLPHGTILHWLQLPLEDYLDRSLSKFVLNSIFQYL